MDQILRPRPGYTGLTNRACESWYDDNECKKYVVKEYLLTDAEFRNTANKIGVICKVGGRRFKVCLDKPGFCRHTYTRDWFLAPKKKREEYIPMDPVKFHLDAGTRCFSEDRYDFLEVQ